MKRIIAFIPFMVCLAFSLALLSCGNDEGATEPETVSSYTIRGSVRYFADETGAAGVTVGISGTYTEATCVADSTGSYSFTGIEDGGYMIFVVETGNIDYYFTPSSRSVTVSGGDVEVSRFFIIKYPKIILRNNGPWSIQKVLIYEDEGLFARHENLVSDPIAGQILPSSDSEEIRIMPGNWGFYVKYFKDSLGRYTHIETIRILPEDSLIYSLNSILKISNKDTRTVTGVKVTECNYTPWGENLLEQEVPPNAMSQDIYIWPGCRDIILIYPQNSDSIDVLFPDVNVAPGDTLVILFDI